MLGEQQSKSLRGMVVLGEQQSESLRGMAVLGISVAACDLFRLLGLVAATGKPIVLFFALKLNLC